MILIPNINDNKVTVKSYCIRFAAAMKLNAARGECSMSILV